MLDWQNQPEFALSAFKHIANKRLSMSLRAMPPVQEIDPHIRYNVLTVNINALPNRQNLAELHEVCDRLQKMGYAESKRVRIYGQDFELISNPFPEGNGIAVRAYSKRDRQARTLQIPLPVLQTLGKKKIA